MNVSVLETAPHLTREHYKVSAFENSWMLREDREHLSSPMVSQGGLLK